MSACLGRRNSVRKVVAQTAISSEVVTQQVTSSEIGNSKETKQTIKGESISDEAPPEEEREDFESRQRAGVPKEFLTTNAETGTRTKKRRKKFKKQEKQNENSQTSELGLRFRTFSGFNYILAAVTLGATYMAAKLY